MSNAGPADEPIDIAEPPPERRITVNALVFWALNFVDRCRLINGVVSPETFVRVDSEDIAHLAALDRLLRAILLNEKAITDVLRGRGAGGKAKAKK